MFCTSSSEGASFGDAVRRFQKGIGQACHVENLERSREDRQGFGVFRLGRASFDQTKAQAPPGALVGEEKAYRPGSDN